jgi:hypothetical protein
VFFLCKRVWNGNTDSVLPLDQPVSDGDIPSPFAHMRLQAELARRVSPILADVSYTFIFNYILPSDSGIIRRKDVSRIKHEKRADTEIPTHLDIADNGPLPPRFK